MKSADRISEDVLVDKEVLIVEDTLSSLTLLSDLIAGAGYHIRQAQDGEMALLSIKNRCPDLILLDVRMPAMDGYEVCRRLKMDPNTRNIPVIFLSALQDKDARLQGLKLGAVDFIVKPYEPDEVLLRVRTHLQLKNLQSNLDALCKLRTRQLILEINERKQIETELRDSRQKLRRLSNYLEDVREAERARIAREIHDELGQTLTVAKIDLARLASNVDNDKADIQKSVADIVGVLEQASDMARTISENLRPGMLDLLGLEAAIDHHVKRFSDLTGVLCTSVVSDKGNLDTDDRIATTAFRIVQEALTNVARHANAKHADIQVADLGGEILIIIQDDGCGFRQDSETISNRFGLMGMSERVHALGGRLSIESENSKGTRVEVTLPFTISGENCDTRNNR